MRAVIFDLDGVLVRTDQAHDKAWRALAVRLGIPFDGRAAARLRGVSRMEALDIVLEGCGHVKDMGSVSDHMEDNQTVNFAIEQ